jgi:hypothetical protein
VTRDFLYDQCQRMWLRDANRGYNNYADGRRCSRKIGTAHCNLSCTHCAQAVAVQFEFAAQVNAMSTVVQLIARVARHDRILLRMAYTQNRTSCMISLRMCYAMWTTLSRIRYDGCRCWLTCGCGHSQDVAKFVAHANESLAAVSKCIKKAMLYS